MQKILCCRTSVSQQSDMCHSSGVTHWFTTHNLECELPAYTITPISQAVQRRQCTEWGAVASFHKHDCTSQLESPFMLITAI